MGQKIYKYGTNYSGISQIILFLINKLLWVSMYERVAEADATTPDSSSSKSII